MVVQTSLSWPNATKRSDFGREKGSYLSRISNRVGCAIDNSLPDVLAHFRVKPDFNRLLIIIYYYCYNSAI